VADAFLLNMRNLSKSKYLNGIQCRRLLWVAVNDAGRIPQPDVAKQYIFDQGHLVGELAHRLYPEGINLDTSSISANLKQTLASLPLRRPLFEAGFSAKRLYCRMDVLHPAGDDEWDIIEVKSTLSAKNEHVLDVEFQRHCCLNAGLKVRNCHVMYLDRDYIKQGELDPNRLFTSEDVTAKLDKVTGEFEERLAALLAVIDSGKCPEVLVGRHCNTPYSCPLHDECWAHMPKHHVMTLYGGKKLGEGLIARGILDIGSIPGDVALDAKQQIQKQCVDGNSAYINKDEIRSFLAGLKYPLYFMDFETLSTAIPVYNGSHPYQTIPFQFSIHSLAAPGAGPVHYSYLAEGPGDPRTAFIAELDKAVGLEGSILVYFAPFEKGILQELADAFPVYRERIASIVERIVDLNTPFSNFSCYHPDQLGSASLKQVLPALTGLGYDELEIAEGQTAGPKFIESVSGDITDVERQTIRNDLIVYCGLDTYGMVETVHRIGEMAKGS
jgi:hypothetical protein